ncbi:MAG: hypothetical protein ACRD4P_09435 [Bryobacteraceae bacterium]
MKTYNKSTDSEGRTCVALPEGTYAVEAGLTGFLNVRYYPVHVTYPNPLHLTFRLPFGDIAEGPLAPETVLKAVLTGTLLFDNKPVKRAKICILQKTKIAAPVTCGTTNMFGEYVLAVAPGSYRTEVRTTRGEIYQSGIDVPNPGNYRNRLRIGPSSRIH